MKIRQEKRMVEVFDTTYIAFDGKEFKTEANCREYEENIEMREIKAEAEKLEIKELEGVYPLDVDGQYITDSHYYTWYRVRDEKDFETITKAYKTDDFRSLKSYPEVICVESNEWDEDVWLHILSDMKASTEVFWKKHGFELEFKEEIDI